MHEATDCKECTSYLYGVEEAYSSSDQKVSTVEKHKHHFLRDKRETFALITRLVGVRGISLIKLGMSPILTGPLRYTPYQTEVNDKVRKNK